MLHARNENELGSGLDEGWRSAVGVSQWSGEPWLVPMADWDLEQLHRKFDYPCEIELHLREVSDHEVLRI